MKTSIFLIALLMNTFSVDAQKSNLELLQGKWQSTDDKTNFLVFEDNHRKEISIRYVARGNTLTYKRVKQ